MIDQLGIALTGVIAIFLTQSKREELRRYACIFGMAGQPFWFWAAWSAGQWGILAMNVLYALAWGKGLWQHWARDLYCGWFHGGGTIDSDEQSVYWQCRKCKRIVR